MHRALFWNPIKEEYIEARGDDIEVLEMASYLEVTGDIEDEAAFARQQSGEEDEDALPG